MSAGYEKGHPDVVQLLLAHGADAQAHDLSGETASDVACGPNNRKLYNCSPTAHWNEPTKWSIISTFVLTSHVSGNFLACLLFVDFHYSELLEPICTVDVSKLFVDYPCSHSEFLSYNM